MTAVFEVRTGLVRVFLLDDTRELRHRVRQALSDVEGLTVIGEADDPVDGLPTIEDLQPDVVVCDLSMPRMDGLEAIPRIAACAPDAGIVIFSGFLSEALGATALGLGADRYVEKSSPLTDLADAVCEVAHARRSGDRPAPVAAPVAPAPPPPVSLREEKPAQLEEVVAEARALPRIKVLALATATVLAAFALSRLLEIVPSTFLVLWFMPVLVLGALYPLRVGVPFSLAAAAAYTYCSYSLGTATWYGAGIGVTSAMLAMLVAAHRLIGWMNRRVEHQSALATELKRSNAELEHFAYVASHDLAAPLRSVSSFTSMLAHRYKGSLDADADKMIGFITSGTARMQRMIDDLLLFARAGSVETERASFDLTGVLDQVRSDLASQIDERQAKVSNGPLPALVADEARIAQVMQNLVANAIKFCPADRSPLVEVTATRLRTAWRIDVSDNGIGVDPRFASKVFGMFQRLHSEDDFPGTGIGLAICQRIVERHGGRIWVDGFEGQGSTFSFTILDPV